MAVMTEDLASIVPEARGREIARWLEAAPEAEHNRQASD
jgi:hypothetical protein